ncbi:MAG: hypothetical protein ACTII7_03825 [Galactobacter sp.]
MSGGRLVVEPLAVQSAEGVVALDFVEPAEGVPLPSSLTSSGGDRLELAVAGAAEFLSHALHTGLRNLSGSDWGRTDRVAEELRTVGLTDLGQRVSALQSGRAEAWFAAQLLLMATQEAL